MGRMKKCIQLFSLLFISKLSYIECHGELVIIHQPSIVNFYDERPLYTSELKYVFGTFLGYLQGKSAEWQDLHLSYPFDFHNIVFMVAVVPGVETLNVTGVIRIPLIEDDHLNNTYSEINLKTTKLFKNTPLNGQSRRFDLTKVEMSNSKEFYQKIEADMLKPLAEAGPHIYWGDYPYFNETDAEQLEAMHFLISQSMNSLAEIVKEPRKPLVALITHTGEITLSRRKRQASN